MCMSNCENAVDHRSWHDVEAEWTCHEFEDGSPPFCSEACNKKYGQTYDELNYVKDLATEILEWK